MEKADVTLRGIAIRYGSSVPVRDLSLDVAGGEFLSLLGPSGCGKTSTLRAIAGFNALEAGDIASGGRTGGEGPPIRRNRARAASASPRAAGVSRRCAARAPSTPTPT